MKPKKLKRNFLRDFHSHAAKMIIADKALSTIPYDEENTEWNTAFDLHRDAQVEMEKFLGNWLAEVTDRFYDTDYSMLKELRVFFDEVVNNYEPLKNTDFDWYVTHSDFA